MKAGAFNMKKRKHFAAVAENLGLPTPKHLCCKTTINSEFGSLFPRAVDAEQGQLLDRRVESTQDSNSFPGDSLSSSTDMILNEGFRKWDSSDEASTSRANSILDTSGNDSHSLGSRNLSFKDDDMEEYQIPHQDNTGWHDIDCLEDCINTHYYKDSQPKTGEELGEFLSSSGMNADIYMLSSERWIVDQEAEMARRKPTIDEEFEQYFSTLML